MTSTYVIACDPGDSSGVAVLDGVGHVMFTWQGSSDDVGSVVRDRLQSLSSVNVVVVTERFTQGSRGPVRTRQTTPQEVITTLNILARNFGADFVEQGPAEVKKMISDHVLRSFNSHLTGSEIGNRDANDVNDALRHAYYYLAVKRRSVYDALLAQRT